MRSAVFASLAYLAIPVLACQSTSTWKMTFYAWPDNDPPGNATAYDCGGRKHQAQGTGTWENPLTMAAQIGRFSPCEVVYSAYLRKYLRMEDTCAACKGDWIDVWIGSTNSNGGNAVMACENTLTGSFTSTHTVVIAPRSDYPVNCEFILSIQHMILIKLQRENCFKMANALHKIRTPITKPQWRPVAHPAQRYPADLPHQQ